MKKTTKRTLILNRETIRELDLKAVSGGQVLASVPHQDCAPSIYCTMGDDCIPTGSVW